MTAIGFALIITCGVACGVVWTFDRLPTTGPIAWATLACIIIGGVLGSALFAAGITVWLWRSMP